MLDIREKELGPDHVDVAASLNNIAVLLKTSGQFEEAEEMYNRSIAIKENALGPNHPQVPTLLSLSTQWVLFVLYRWVSKRGHVINVDTSSAIIAQHIRAGVPNKSKPLGSGGMLLRLHKMFAAPSICCNAACVLCRMPEDICCLLHFADLAVSADQTGTYVRHKHMKLGSQYAPEAKTA